MNDRAEVNNLCRPPVREPLAAPIGSLLGLTLIREGVGRTTMEFEADDRSANPTGTLHGWNSLRYRRRCYGNGISLYPRRGRDIHHHRTENQLPAPGLEGEASCRGENGSCR